MLRIIWMIVEGILASIGALFIVLYIKLAKYFYENPEIYDKQSDMSRKILGDKQD